jgi:WD40 repeat protein
MKIRTLATLVLMLLPVLARCQEIVETATLGPPVRQRVTGWKSHVDYVQWTGDTLAAGGRSGMVRCFSLQTKQQRWSVQLENEIRSLSAAGSKDRLYALDDRGFIHVFRLSDGKKLNVLSAEQMARRVGISFLAPTNMTWIPVADQLLVTHFSKVYGDNGILFDAATFKKTATTRSDGFVTKATTDPGGRFIVTVSSRDNVRIWDTKVGDEIFKLGDEEERATDAPFISNARFDGQRTLVYTVDNSWARGKVHVHDIQAQKDTATFDSRNGHVVMDVDFSRGRIALTGTEKALTVLDLAGNVIAEKAAVTLQRNVAIAFSPTGKRLAVGSQDNTIRIFNIDERVAD